MLIISVHLLIKYMLFLSMLLFVHVCGRNKPINPAEGKASIFDETWGHFY